MMGGCGGQGCAIKIHILLARLGGKYRKDKFPPKKYDNCVTRKIILFESN